MKASFFIVCWLPMLVKLIGFRNAMVDLIYRRLVKPLLFRVDAERVHESMLTVGSWLGKVALFRGLTKVAFGVPRVALEVEIGGVYFPAPVGLAAGFDYQAKLPGILSSLGFGFGTIGTLTHGSYQGNPPPRLGRLPKSRSLLVYKGYKNAGVRAVAKQLAGKQFDLPVGISIGTTNSAELNTIDKAIADILAAFEVCESADLHHAYYELNISCPNLIGGVSFYRPEDLERLLAAVDTLQLTRPVFLKMPIEKSDDVTMQLVEVAIRHHLPAVIIGNLQKDRQDPSLVAEEVARFAQGNFSGKATWQRSNELIALVYRRYGQQIKIIGCGGIFSAQDALVKLQLGASALQLITGMIYEGPQVIASIALGLESEMRERGLKQLSELTGTGVN